MTTHCPLCNDEVADVREHLSGVHKRSPYEITELMARAMPGDRGERAATSGDWRSVSTSHKWGEGAKGSHLDAVLDKHAQRIADCVTTHLDKKKQARLKILPVEELELKPKTEVNAEEFIEMMDREINRVFGLPPKR